jgi:hypothetical protein
MQGKCSTQPDAANFPSMNGVPLVRTTSGQCLLHSNHFALGVLSSNFWADNLYLRTKATDRQETFPVLALMLPVSSSRYLTNMIFQGDGEGGTTGIAAADKVFVSGSHHTRGMF